MSGPQPLKKIVAFAHSGLSNLGDEATMAAFIENVRRRHPSAEILAFTMNPAETQQRHRIPAYPVRRQHNPGRGTGPAADSPSAAAPARRASQWVKRLPVVGTVLRGLRAAARSLASCAAEMVFLVKSSRRLKGTDLFVVVGGGQLTDYFGGPWGFPLTILKWCLLARARGAELAFLGAGAGPLNTRPGKLLVRWALSLASYRSFRDESSRRLVESLGVSGENHVSPDLAHGLRPPPAAGANGAGVVGINPLPYYDSRYWAEENAGVYQRHVQTLASVAARLIEAGQKVVLFPTQLRADPLVIKDVEALVRERLPGLHSDALTCPPVSSIDDLFAVIAKTDIVVASRFHGVVLSLLLGRLVIGLSYNPKTDDLMTDVGLGEFVMDIGRVEVPWLVSRIERLRGDPERYRQQIEAKRSSYLVILENQYGSLLGGFSRPEPCLAPQTV